MFTKKDNAQIFLGVLYFLKNIFTFSQVCRVENCYLTTNKSLLNDISEFDALLFHMSGVSKYIDNMPAKRSPNQRYIISTAAPPKDEKFSYHDKLK